MSPVDTSQLAADMASIRSYYSGKKAAGGTGEAIMFGSDEPPVERVDMGSHMLNYATGGGAPIGRWTRLYGPWSSGKSLTCWKVIANAQKMGMTCAYYNIEKQFDPIFAALQGVDINNLVVVQGTIMEQIGVKLEKLLGSVHLHVLDSCSSAVSIEELNASMEDWQMGLKARVWGKIFYKVLERFDERENMVILVDQVRDTFGGSGAAQPPGGRFIEHTSSLSISYRKSSWLWYDDNGVLSDGATGSGLSGDVEPDGIEFMARVEKCRVGRPLKTARMRYSFGRVLPDGTKEPGRIDNIYELAQMATYFGVVEKTSAQSSYYKRADGKAFADGSQTKQGVNKLRQVIDGDPDLQDLIVAAYRRHM